MLLAALPLLAETVTVTAGSLPDPQSSAATGWLFVAIGGLAVTVNQILGALANFRKLKAPDGALDERFKKMELDIREVELRMEKRMGENLGEIKTRLQTLESTLSHVVGDINYALGQMASASRNNNNSSPS